MDFSPVVDNIQYLMLGRWPNGPLGGAALTVVLSVVSALCAGVLGLLGGIALSLPPPRRHRRRPWLVPLLVLAVAAGAVFGAGRGSADWVAVFGVLALVALAGAFRKLPALLRAFIALLRSVPVLLLIFWIYFLLPIVFGLDVPGTGTVVVALSLIGGAYLSHSVHAGIRSLPAGQWQAALALGLTRWQALRWVILPQALPTMTPSFINQWIALIKDTSLAYVIGVGELSFVATQVNNRTMVHAAEIFLFVALVYFIICTALELVANAVAARLHTRPGLRDAPR